jgi:hypothetical protein
MAEMICPWCDEPLSPEEITRLWAQLSASKRKTFSGGRNGGRPPLKPVKKKRKTPNGGGNK